MSSSNSSLRALAALVYEHTSVTVHEDRWSMLCGRVGRRVRALGLKDTAEYVRLIKTLDSAASEIAEFIDVVTTHKTSFFRTRSVWESLLLDGRDATAFPSFRAWSCACSRGHEAYSIAMLGRTLRSFRPDLQVSVLASDVSSKIVEQASHGVFNKEDVTLAAASMPDIQVQTLFEAEEGSDGERLVAAKELRNLIRFRPHNLTESASGVFDVAFLRNVLIYFTPEDKELVVRNVIRSIRIGGALVIGESESLLGRSDELEYVAPCIYRKLR